MLQRLQLSGQNRHAVQRQTACRQVAHDWVVQQQAFSELSQGHRYVSSVQVTLLRVGIYEKSHELVRAVTEIQRFHKLTDLLRFLLLIRFP